MQDEIKDEWIEAGWAAVVGSDIASVCHTASFCRGDLKDALAAVAPLIRAELEAENERLLNERKEWQRMARDFAATADNAEAREAALRAELAQARAQAMEEAARVADANRQYDDGDPWNVGWNVCAEEIANAIRALAARPASEEPKGWRPIESAPKDGTMLQLLVQFEEHATEDSAEPCITIGANNGKHDGNDHWKFAGWDWCHDCFTEGKGTPVGWLPLAGLPAAPAESKGESE